MVILFTFGCFVVIFTSFGAICHIIVGLSSFCRFFYLYFVYFDGFLWGYVAYFG